MKNKGRILGKLRSKLLRGTILLVISVLPFFSYSQQTINIVNEGLIQVKDTILGVDTIISSHSSKDNAIESLINYTNKTGRKTARIYGQITRVDVDGLPVGTPIDKIEIDTITDIRDNNKGYINMVHEPTNFYIPFKGLGTLKIETDTIYNKQNIYRLKRTKEFGKVTYENLDIPFQILDYWLIPSSNNSTVFHCEIYGKQSSIKSFIDKKPFKEFNPGTSAELGEEPNVFYFLFTFTGLKDGDNLLMVEVANEEGEIDTVEFNIKL